MLILGLVLACAAPEPGACPPTGCDEVWAAARWEAEPEAVTRAIAAQSDPVRRLAMVVAVSEAHPGEARALCELLDQGTDRRYCDNVHGRPHLRPRTREEDPRKPRSLGVDALPVLWAELQPQEVHCPATSLRRSCQTEAAVDQARQAAPWASAPLCNALGEAKWREECLFLASEAALQEGHVAASAQLCLATEAVRDRCFHHLVRILHTRSPRGAPAGAEAWSATLEAVAALRAILGEDGEEVVARVWARSIMRSYSSAEQVTGAPLGALPEEAAPFVRAAAAQRLWALEAHEDRPLAGWVARLDLALADRSPGRVGAPGLDPPDAVEPWLELGPGEGPMDTVPWFGPVSRALGPTPESELAIVILEAAVRAPGERALGLVVEGLGHDTAEVRWTAARALGILDPTHAALVPLERDVDPRVATRAVAVRALHAPVQLVVPRGP